MEIGGEMRESREVTGDPATRVFRLFFDLFLASAKIWFLKRIENTISIANWSK